MAQSLSDTDQRKSSNFLATATVILVRLFGSWGSILIHTLFFISWWYFQLDLQTLLVIVSLEAIFIGIFILMAENVETQQKERLQELKRQQDMSMVKQDVMMDEKALEELAQIKKQIRTLQTLLQEKVN